MQYQHFDPTACGFPLPAVPILPRLGAQTLGRGGPGAFTALGAGGHVQSFTRGRYALTQAYRLAGVEPDAAILISAYHCRTMLDPAIRLGAPIVLYALRPDLSPNLAALARSVAHSPQPVKALLLTHYFGFAQDLGPVLDFCAQHGITLIEDCSHALFIPTDSAAGADAAHGSGQNLNMGMGMGQTGRYGVASPYKFFASQDGGLLLANAPDAPPLAAQTPQPLKQQIKGINHALQASLVKTAPPPRMPPSSPPPTTRGTDTLEDSPATSPYYQLDQEPLQSLAVSRWVMRHTNTQRLAKRRRQHYQQWVSAVAGVPIWRWDDMAVSDCAVATHYRLHLLHLPCHQELTAEQMAWMTHTVAGVMHNPPTLQQPHPQNLHIKSAPNTRH